MSTRKRISKDDAALFRAAMKDTQPLAKSRKRPPKRPPARNTDTLDWDDAEDTSPVVDKRFAEAVDAPPKLKSAPPPANSALAKSLERAKLAPGKSGDLDKRTQRRMRRGKMEIDGRLDLHGMTQTAAHRALGRFIAGAQGPERRCVLVITGKGLLKDGQGVLKEAVPRWLNEGQNRERVLSFSHAAPADGGTGALYVLLRRAK